MTQSVADKQNTEKLFRKYRETGNERIRNELVEKNLYLAEILSRKYQGRGVDYEDLYQVASYALLLAVNRFDPDKGVLFSSFATPTIIGEIKKYFRDTTWSLKVPRRLKEITMQIPDAKERLQKELGHIPTVFELAEELGVSEEEILEALESNRAFTTYSLDQEIDTDSDSDNLLYEKYLGQDEDGYGSLEMTEMLEKIMKELSDTEKEIMRKRFFQEMTQREVADALGLSQMTVSRIEKAMKNKFQTEYSK